MAGRDRQQIRGPFTLRPKRLPSRRAPAREQQRPPGGLAETRGKERRAPERLTDAFFHLCCAGQKPFARRWLIGGGKTKDHAVVRPNAFDVTHTPRAEHLSHGGCPRRMHPRSEWGQHANAVIADFVDEALNDDLAIARHGARLLELLVHVVAQRLRRIVIEEVSLAQELTCMGRLQLGESARKFANPHAKRASCPAHRVLERPARGRA